MLKCPFCTMFENEERVIIKNDFAWAFPTNIPVVPGHVLISPIRHVATFDELTNEERTAIFELEFKIKSALIKLFSAEGFNYGWNEGKLSGQRVPHFHLHVLPRKEGDTGILEYEPRKFLYRPGERETTPEEELKEITEIIRKAL